MNTATLLYIRLIFLLMLLMFLAARLNCSDRADLKKPQTPYVGFYNPHQYQLGRVLDAEIIHPEPGKTWLSVIWAPSYAPLLYTEQINFCNGPDVVQKFHDVKFGDEVVLVYGRILEFSRIDSPPHGTVNCRSLDAVRRMNAPSN